MAGDKQPSAGLKDKDRCNAWAASSDARCKLRRLKVFGSQYCLLHQPKRSILMAACVSLALGWGGNWLYSYTTKATPELSPYLNGVLIKEETVFICATNTSPQDLEISV